MQQKNVHWFPGHMVKAMREIEDRIKVIDVVVEVVDARAPLSSKNPFLEKITNGKKRLIVFTKKDLCDLNKIFLFEKYYQEKGYATLISDLNDKKDVNSIVNKIIFLGQERQEKYLKKGMKPQPLRVMIIGIPNVGKSTLINRLAKKNAASARNTPGHTRAQQWIRINGNFELLDTPGILPPHYEDKQTSINLALIGSIKENILPLDELYSYLIKFLQDNYLENANKRYSVDFSLPENEITKNIALKRGLLIKGGEIDEESTKKLVLREFKDGLISLVVVDSYARL